MKMPPGLQPVWREFARAGRNFTREGVAVGIRLTAYLGVVGIMALFAVKLFAALPVDRSVAAHAVAQWTVAGRLQPAFDLPPSDSAAKTWAYEALRHSQGGRKDILSGPTGASGVPLMQLEIYRPGAELTTLAGAGIAAAGAEIAAQLAPAGLSGGQPAGMLDSKFGPVALLQFSRSAANSTVPVADGAPAHCMGFATASAQNPEALRLRISGWTCQGETATAQRADLGCTLNRLTLLSSGSDARLAALFARAELKRRDCGDAPSPTAASWISSPDEPRLRGAFATDLIPKPAS